MFKKKQERTVNDKYMGNKNTEIADYFSNLSHPSVSRQNEPYYIEMQQLAFNLVRYLKMQTKERPFQANYNMTYLRENMTKANYLYVVEKFLGGLNAKDWKRLIESTPWEKETREEMEQMVDAQLESPTQYRVVYKPIHEEVSTVYVSKEDLEEAISKLNKTYAIETLQVFQN